MATCWTGCVDDLVRYVGAPLATMQPCCWPGSPAVGSPGGAAVPGGRPANLNLRQRRRQGTIRTLSRLGGAGTALTTAGDVGGALGVSESTGDVGAAVVGTGVVGREWSAPAWSAPVSWAPG